MTSEGTSHQHERFTTQAEPSENALQHGSTGFMQLSDFRKRKIEDGTASSNASGAESTDQSPDIVSFKKKKKTVKKAALSFADEDEHDAGVHTEDFKHGSTTSTTDRGSDSADVFVKKKLKANNNIAFQPKSQSKASLAKEAQIKETLKKQYLQIQDAVKATDFMLPFVFFDGKDHVGGKVRMKKGDRLWLFLERARKVGADTASNAGAARKDWARISVDDLLLVKQGLILPQHHDFHYFVVNQSHGYDGRLFDLSAEPTVATPPELLPESDPRHVKMAESSDPTGLLLANEPRFAESSLEGLMDDPSLTKVVDRRWFERNKHIFPANIWEDFDPNRDYSKSGRKDREGNQMFFSR